MVDRKTNANAKRVLEWKTHVYKKKQLERRYFRKIKSKILVFQFNQHFSSQDLLQEHITSFSAF